MDRYSNAIYLTPMGLGALASICAAAWRFLGAAKPDAGQDALEALCTLPGRIRKIDVEAELTAIEDQVDAIIRNELAKSSHRNDDDDSDIQALMLVAQRIDNLVHYRRTMLTAAPPPRGDAA